MTEEELEAISKACAEATPGPWRWGDGGWCLNSYASDVHEVMSHVDDPAGTPSAADAAFLANARQWVPALVAEVRRLRAELLSHGSLHPLAPAQLTRKVALEEARRAVLAEMCDAEACGHEACIALERAEKAVRALAADTPTR